MNSRARNSNIEGLRIIAMLMIITLHYLLTGGVLDKLNFGDKVFNIAWIIESFCYSSVNCYILISGYFLCKKDYYSIKKIAQVAIQAVFYSAGLYVLFCVTGIEKFNIATLITGYLFPITHGEYWYATVYVVSLFAVPYVNTIIRAISQKQHKRLLVEFGIVFSVIPSAIFFSGNTIGLMGGYSLIWFIYLYFAAGYIRNYGIGVSRRKLLTGYFCFSLIPFVSKCAQLQFLGKEYWDFYRYNSIFILLSAVCLFGWVVTSKERNSRVINSIAGTTFGIFLFHTQYIMRDTVL